MAREVRVAILGDARDFQRAVRDVQGGASKMDRALGGVKKAAIALGGAYAATEVLQFGSDLVEAAEESQKVTRQTAAVIKSMGNAAKVSATQVADLASELSLKAGIDDELIQSGQNVLLTFGKIRNEVGKGNDVFDQATRLTLDLSVALGKDMNSSAIMVGKALNDPIAGITALTRAGVQFTAQQKEQIKALVAVGDTLGAQKIILAELDRQFAGSAEAQATATGKLQVAWDNVKETLGTALLPVVQTVSLWLAEHLPTAADKTVAKLRELRDWVRENKTEAYAYAAAVAVVAAALFAATFPITATVAGLVALSFATGYVVERFNLLPKAGRVFQWITDYGVVPLVDRIRSLLHLVRRLVSAFNDLKDAVEDMPGGGDGIIGTAIKGSPLGPLLKRAKGGPVRAGRSYLVGEQGPEVLTMGGNGHVTPNDALSVSGGDITVNISGRIDRDTLADTVHELRKVRLEMAG